MAQSITAFFNRLRTKKPEDAPAAHMLLFFYPTHDLSAKGIWDNPELLAEQEAHLKVLEDLQAASGRDFPHLNEPVKGNVGPVWLVCTKEIAKQLESLPFVLMIAATPELPRSGFKKRTERTSTISFKRETFNGSKYHRSF